MLSSPVSLKVIPAFTPGAFQLYCLCWSEALFAVGNAVKQ